MNNTNEPYILFTKEGNLELRFKLSDEKTLIKDIKGKFGNKTGFLMSLFDLQVELEKDINFNQILNNLKFFEKEFEVFFSEIKAPKNNLAAQKIFELMKQLNKEHNNFLSIMNEERNLLSNSLLRATIPVDVLTYIVKRKEFEKQKLNVCIKKVVTERQTLSLTDKSKNTQKQIFINTRAKIYQDDEILNLHDVNPILLLAAVVEIDTNSENNYVLSFEDIVKSLFKDLLIFRSKDEIQEWKETLRVCQVKYAKNVVYLSDIRNKLKYVKLENVLIKVFNNDNNEKTQEEIKEAYIKSVEERIVKNNKIIKERRKNIFLVSNNKSIVSSKSMAEIQVIK